MNLQVVGALYRMCFLHSDTLYIMAISFTKSSDHPKVSWK